MNIKELDTVICPYCDYHFTLHLYDKTPSEIKYGSVCCLCDEFPIVEGILILHKSKAKSILNYIQQKQYKKAFFEAAGFYESRKKRFLTTVFPGLLFVILHNNFVEKKQVLLHKLFWNIIVGKSKSEYNYFFNRKSEADSLLFFIPLGFRKDIVHWVDVGSGIFTYYADLKKSNPLIHIFSVESVFINSYFSKLYFYSSNATYICSDFSSGYHFKKNILDVVTFIDSFQGMKQQKMTLRLVFTNNYLKKNGIVFLSGIPEHIYLNPFIMELYPVKKDMLNKMAGKLFEFYKHPSVSSALLKKSTIEEYKISYKDFSERYCALYTEKKLRFKPITLPIQHKNIKYFTWETFNTFWKNNVY